MGRKKSKLSTKRGDKAAPDLRDRQDAFFQIFAQNVVDRRKARGLSQVDLAVKTGLARAYINRVENEPLACNLYAASLIAKALGTTLDKLCREET